MIVVDANVALCWVLKATEEQHRYAAEVAQAGLSGEPLIAPAVLLAECSYVLLKDGRREKWGNVKTAEYAEVIALFGIQLHALDATLPENVRFALRHNVSGFDAYYLALALRAGARMATFDKGLIAACKLAGVPLF